MAMLRNPPADAPERQGRWVFLCLVTAKAISKRACVRPRAGDEDLVAGSAGAIFIEGGRDAMAPEKMVRPGIAHDAWRAVGSCRQVPVPPCTTNVKDR